jgi:hypothetical protein
MSKTHHSAEEFHKRYRLWPTTDGQAINLDTKRKRARRNRPRARTRRRKDYWAAIQMKMERRLVRMFHGAPETGEVVYNWKPERIKK